MSLIENLKVYMTISLNFGDRSILVSNFNKHMPFFLNLIFCRWNVESSKMLNGIYVISQNFLLEMPISDHQNSIFQELRKCIKRVFNLFHFYLKGEKENIGIVYIVQYI